mmetsp:Transcript_20260/g.44241  ORF Transcript_20260/g.44241 Transcript_20260/m.44241 type:complete len:391 (+) Transcript_20260:187-1359(+)|eukprot:CAMPEP_0206425986 /NCGR_PEP_ID=MMETSP0324_2-20121206/4111_1 /ASSEMBLY_ACC=CAM_ASM_000836 /TAXON_ID=2866 /ORGANISM="Crypthecodinium cohnii, Strain Seligo" /LENGTH=390 /DNA_ID=CAMNT_0053890859 /DNA_START=94 /DNA_END=1266 /DNA_ORIENTATION=-
MAFHRTGNSYSARFHPALILSMAIVPARQALASFEFVGDGSCLSADGNTYNSWSLKTSIAEKTLTYEGYTCECRDCAQACGLFTQCVGYEVQCCSEGDASCTRKASLLFSEESRVDAPSGENFTFVNGPKIEKPATGLVSSSSGGTQADGFCFKKTQLDTTSKAPPSGKTVTGYTYEPADMEGFERTLVLNWEGCQERCQQSTGCITWAYWPDGGCHIQGANTKLVKATCPVDMPVCQNLAVVSGPRDFSDKWYPSLPSADSQGVDASPFHQDLDSLPVVGALLGEVAHLEKEVDPAEVRKWFSIIMSIIFVAWIVYCYAQAKCSRRWEKKRRILATERKRARQAKLRELRESAKMAAAMEEGSSDSGSWEQASEVSSDSERPLSKKLLS